MRNLALAVCFSALVACVDAPSEPTETASQALATNNVSPEIANVAQHPHAAICGGGRFRCFAQRRTNDAGNFIAYAQSQGLGATDLVSAYNLDTSVDPGATIAIIDAYGYTNLASDLATYRTHYGLPACTVASGCLKIVNQQGATSPLPANPPPNDDWTGETALDVQVASAACPKCKLLVVLADDDQGDGLMIANTTAASLGATVISNSWGSPESGASTIASSEAYFDHPGIAIFVASGDNGYDDGGQGPDYPSTSAFTIGVGGTTLVASSNSRGWTEAAWSSGGSSCSTSVAKPAWQTSTACANRMASDVSAVGDPNTGVAVYNASQGGWAVIGGTSAASPLVAAIFALTKHGDTTAAFAYANTAAFNDVTSGKNGTCTTALCKAAAGWDGPTGIGTPDGAKLSALGGSGSGGGGTSTGSGSGTNIGSGSDAGSAGGSSTTGGGSDTTDTSSGTSGGCSAGGGMAGSGSLIVIGLAALRRGRRRS